MTRLAVPKTYKLYIGGKFPRSESGRVYAIRDFSGAFLANAAMASRKDARDAVVAARSATAGWAAATGYNRGQVLYRIAELLEGRREQFILEICQGEGVTASAAESQLNDAIDTWIWYAGWADKYAHVLGSTNPVSGPYFNISTPEATGVVAIIAPQQSSLLGLVSVIAPALVSGNTVVVVASEFFPLTALSLSEVLATSDVPGGVVNILTGSPAEIAPWLAGHADVNALDLAGAGDMASSTDPAGAGDFNWVDLQIAAAETLKRVLVPEVGVPEPSIDRISFFTETKTVWHTKSLI